MDGSSVKAEESADHRTKSGYKSWKKKYRKMRIVFDRKMQEGEELHKKEAKASATVKRLAIDNDRLLDLLLDINNSPQMPPDKRIDVSIRPSANSKLVLPLDQQHAQQKDPAMKRLEQLIQDIPHSSYLAAKEARSAYLSDIAVPEGDLYPSSFLSADDIDNYLHEVDSSIDPESHIPTLAPRAHPGSQLSSQHPHLKNPTSVTNWLRKHAPKIFLQDGETQDGGDGDDGTGNHNHHNHHPHHGSGRKTRGSRSERGGGGAGGGGSSGRGRGKRASMASRVSERDRPPAGDWDASMDEDADFSTPVGRGGKRKRDDDPGYRPGGSLGRPIKKKRKSDLDGTPTTSSARKSKKETSTPKRES